MPLASARPGCRAFPRTSEDPLVGACRAATLQDCLVPGRVPVLLRHRLKPWQVILQEGVLQDAERGGHVQQPRLQQPSHWPWRTSMLHQ